MKGLDKGLEASQSQPVVSLHGREGQRPRLLDTPTLSAPATPGSTGAQRGVSVPPPETPRPPRLLWQCGGEILFRGQPIHMATARCVSAALRREACDEVSDALWAVYHQAREAIADALAWRGVATIHSNERRA